MEDQRNQEESCQQRIIKAKENLATAEAEFENLPPYEIIHFGMCQFFLYCHELLLSITQCTFIFR